MMTIFEVIAEPARRSILDLLSERERTVSEIVAELEMSQPGVSRHLRVLRDEGLVRSRVDAQRRVYSLRPQRLSEIDEWLARYRGLWVSNISALESHPRRHGRQGNTSGRRDVRP